jgi:hypothetical protein
LPLSGHGAPTEPSQPDKVVGKIGQAYLHSCAPTVRGGKDAFDPRSHPGAGRAAEGDVAWHLLAFGLLALELRSETAAREQGLVGSGAVDGVGPDIAGRVIAIEHRAELAAIINSLVTV